LIDFVIKLENTVKQNHLKVVKKEKEKKRNDEE
jgi:hypothetical protein